MKTLRRFWAWLNAPRYSDVAYAAYVQHRRDREAALAREERIAETARAVLGGLAGDPNVVEFDHRTIDAAFRAGALFEDVQAKRRAAALVAVDRAHNFKPED